MMIQSFYFAPALLTISFLLFFTLHPTYCRVQIKGYATVRNESIEDENDLSHNDALLTSSSIIENEGTTPSTFPYETNEKEEAIRISETDDADKQSKKPMNHKNKFKGVKEKSHNSAQKERQKKMYDKKKVDDFASRLINFGRKAERAGESEPSIGESTTFAPEETTVVEVEEATIPEKDLIRWFGGSNDDNLNQFEVADTKLNTAPRFKVTFLLWDEIEYPFLKHFSMYEAKFYPAWTYYGFFSPLQWHKVPIQYFTRPPRKKFNRKLLKKHKTFMKLCSKKVTLDSQKCHETIQNECMNDTPSPIDIITSEAVEDKNMDVFNFFLFDAFFQFKMFIPEDGTDMLFLELIIPKRALQKNPGLSQGSVGNVDLYFDRASFHFGKDRLNGSEHLIDGKRYGMEIQLYFTAEGSGTYWEAVSKYKFMRPNDPKIGRNTHIFSVMVEVTRPGAAKPDDPEASFADRFEILSSAAQMFWKANNPHKLRGVKVDKKLISLNDFIGIPAKGPYFTYEGSLSHPPCLQHAKWTVFKNPIWITYEQWLRFATIHSEFSDENFLAGNYRPIEEILIRVNVPTYLEMRKLEGFRELDQKELNLEIMKNNPYNAAVAVNASKEELFVVRQYKEFTKFYARKVKKRRQITEQNKHDDYDYYDVIGEGLDKSSGTNLLKFYYYFRMTAFLNVMTRFVRILKIS